MWVIPSSSGIAEWNSGRFITGDERRGGRARKPQNTARSSLASLSVTVFNEKHERAATRKKFSRGGWKAGPPTRAGSLQGTRLKQRLAMSESGIFVANALTTMPAHY